MQSYPGDGTYSVLPIRHNPSHNYARVQVDSQRLSGASREGANMVNVDDIATKEQILAVHAELCAVLEGLSRRTTAPRNPDGSAALTTAGMQSKVFPLGWSSARSIQSSACSDAVGNLQRRIRHHVRFRRRWRIGHHWGWRP